MNLIVYKMNSLDYIIFVLIILWIVGVYKYIFNFPKIKKKGG